MCHTWATSPRHELTAAELSALLNDMPELLWLDVTGGEPFLRRDVHELFEVIAAATPRLRVLHFQTNGWFRDRIVRVARALVERRPDVQLIVTVSIDGPEPDHDALRGVPGSFRRALETFVALRAMPGVDVYVGTTVTPFNAEAVETLEPAIRASVPGFRASEWHWNWMQLSDHFFGNGALRPLPKVGAQHLVKEHVARRGIPRSLVEVMELLFLVNLEFYRRGEPSGVTCQALRSAAFVSPEGDLYPCHVYDRPLGNVREKRLSALWSSCEVATARDEIVELACGGCFTPCEAYPALAGAPLQTIRATARRGLSLLREEVT
jgi:radical SAM protein with 4Fe4S-binding SPASM domain